MDKYQQSLEESLISRGLNTTRPSSTYVDFADQIAKNQAEQKAQEESLKLAKEHVEQAKYQTRNEQEARAAGANPLLANSMTPEEARSYLKIVTDAKGLEIEQAAVDEWVASLPERVNRDTVEAFANRFARASTRAGQPAQFQKKDRIAVPAGSTAEELGLIEDADPKFAHVPEDGMYQVIYDNQGVIKKFIPGGKENAVKDDGLTPGQKAVDVNFGKDYAEWVGEGGATKVQQNLAKLKVVIEALDNRDDLTGPVISALPDAARKRLYPESQDMQDVISEVVQQNLKLILGGQFTQQEAFALIQRAYNLSLEEKQNATRVRRTIDQLKKAADIKTAAVEYFEQHGTLKGFDGYERIMSVLNSDLNDKSVDKPKDNKDATKPKTKVPKYTVEK